MVSTAPIPRLGQWPSALPRFRTDKFYRAFAAKEAYDLRHIRVRVGGEIFESLRPAYGYLYAFNPNTDTFQNAVDFMVTALRCLETHETLTVTEPTGGWLRTYDAETATTGNMFDVIATMAYDIQNGAQDWTVEDPPSESRYLRPAGYTAGQVMDFLGTLLKALNTEATI